MRDSRTVISHLASDGRRHDQGLTMSNILEECKKLMSRPWEVKCIHIFREQIGLADGMAKAALQQGRGLRVFDRPPVSIQTMLVEDMMGIPSSRWIGNKDHTS